MPANSDPTTDSGEWEDIDSSGSDSGSPKGKGDSLPVAKGTSSSSDPTGPVSTQDGSGWFRQRYVPSEPRAMRLNKNPRLFMRNAPRQGGHDKTKHGAINDDSAFLPYDSGCSCSQKRTNIRTGCSSRLDYAFVIAQSYIKRSSDWFSVCRSIDEIPNSRIVMHS